MDLDVEKIIKTPNSLEYRPGGERDRRVEAVVITDTMLQQLSPESEALTVLKEGSMSMALESIELAAVIAEEMLASLDADLKEVTGNGISFEKYKKSTIRPTIIPLLTRSVFCNIVNNLFTNDSILFRNFIEFSGFNFD